MMRRKPEKKSVKGKIIRSLPLTKQVEEVEPVPFPTGEDEKGRIIPPEVLALYRIPHLSRFDSIGKNLNLPWEEEEVKEYIQWLNQTHPDAIAASLYCWQDNPYVSECRPGCKWMKSQSGANSCVINDQLYNMLEKERIEKYSRSSSSSPLAKARPTRERGLTQRKFY